MADYLMQRLLYVAVVSGLVRGFTPSGVSSNSAAGVTGNNVDRNWDPLEPGEVNTYYPPPRQWTPSVGPPIPQIPPNYGITVPTITAPAASCWTTPSIVGAAVISVLAIGAIVAAKLPLVIVAPAVLTLLSLPLALPLLAPILALAMILPMPGMDDSTDDPIAMMKPGVPPVGMSTKPNADDGNKKPPNKDDDKESSQNGGNARASTIWNAINADGQRCLQKVACQLGRHAGDSGLWMVEKLGESEWTVFRDAYLEGTRNVNQSDDRCGKFRCNAKTALAVMTAASGAKSDNL